ncbi:MAG: hypothetical protein HUU08_07045 [Candidatus Brocadia sp.]|nr:hypothetical protein [Candidatus Brocadia sp.]
MDDHDGIIWSRWYKGNSETLLKNIAIDSVSEVMPLSSARHSISWDKSYTQITIAYDSKAIHGLK